jgi:ABC-type sugar transport system ATPase subunit
MPSVLELHNISKTFGGVKALDDVHFDVRAGEVHALLGEISIEGK